METAPVIILNSSAVSIDWSIGVQHFSLGLYRSLIDRLPGATWRLIVPEGQQSRYETKINASNLSYWDQGKNHSTGWSSWVRQWLGPTSRYVSAFTNRMKFSPPLRHLNSGRMDWWEMVERGTSLEFCPSQVTGIHSKLPLVLTCHDLHPWNVPWQYSNLDEVKATVTGNLLHAKAVVVSWPHPFREISQRFPEYSDKMFMIPFPVMINKREIGQDESAQIREIFNLPSRFVVYSARLQPHKNHKQLLRAFSLVKRELEDVCLVCPGPAITEEYRSEILQLCNDLGLGSHVRFPGYISDRELQGLYTLCDAVVAPTLAEATSGTMVEGFAYGKPVACSNIPPLKTFIEWVGGQVRYFDPMSPQNMADAIIDVLQNPGAYRDGSLRAAGRLKTLSWSTTADQYIDVFRWVLDGCDINKRPEWGDKPIIFQK